MEVFTASVKSLETYMRAYICIHVAKIRYGQIVNLHKTMLVHYSVNSRISLLHSNANDRWGLVWHLCRFLVYSQ